MEAPLSPGEFDVPLAAAASSREADAGDVPVGEPVDVGELTGDPTSAFRRTVGMLGTGVTVVTARSGERVHGMAANAFMPGSLEPPLVLASLEREARLGTLLQEGTRFGVSVLSEEQADLSDRLARHTDDDLPAPRFVVVRDTPLVDGALAHLVARVVRSYWGGDHTLFLGQVEYARYGEGRPLLLHGGPHVALAGPSGVFSALPRELLDPLLARGEELSFADGDVLMRLGEPADALFLVLEGTVRVERPGRFTRLVAGDLVGEIEVLARGPRIANIHAEGPVRVLRVPRDALLVALEADARAAMALIEVLANRFRETA